VRKLTIPKATIFGVAEVSESGINRINAGSKIDMNRPEKPRRKKRNEVYSILLQGKLDHQPQEERQLRESLLLKDAHLFHDEKDNEFNGTDSQRS